jgi:hypothetical protein
MAQNFTLLVTGSGLIHAAHPGDTNPLCGATRCTVRPFGEYPGIRSAAGACAACYAVAGVR